MRYRRYNKGMVTSEVVRKEHDSEYAGLPPYDILSDEFTELAISAFLAARARALAAGIPVVYEDPAGFPVQEWPDGRRFEIRFRPGAPRAEHIEIVRELTARAA